MDAIRFMLIMFITLSLIGWFFAWYTFEEEKGKIVYPPYGVSQCPDLWVYGGETCVPMSYNNKGATNMIKPKNFLSNCSKYDWLKSPTNGNNRVVWDGIYDGREYNSYFDNCCKGEDRELC